MHGTLLLDSNHALCHISTLLRFEQIEQGMLCTICIPQREYRIIGKAVSLVNLHIIATILAIYIHIDGGVDHGVIHRSIEESLLVLCTLDIYGTEFLFPLTGCLLANLIESLSFGLSLQIS